MTDKQTVKFGDICREVKLTTKDPIADGYERYIGLEHLDSGSLKIKRWGIIAEDNPSFTRVFKKGHILFGKRRPYLKKAAIAEFDGICSGDIVVMEPQANGISSDLIGSLISTTRFWDWAVKTSSGSLSPRTKFKSLAEFELSRVPSEKERSTFNSINTKIKSSAQERLITGRSLEGIAEAVLRDKLGSNYWPCEADIRKLNNSEGIVRFGSVLDVGPQNGMYKSAKFYGSGLPIIHMEDLFSSDVISDVSNAKLISVSKVEYNKYKLRNGDLLFARTSLVREGAGRCFYCSFDEKDVVFESNVTRVRLNESLCNPMFYFYLFNSKLGRWHINRLIGTLAASSITGGDLKRMHIPLPELELQNDIAAKLYLLREAADSIVKTDSASIELLSHLRESFWS